MASPTVLTVSSKPQNVPSRPRNSRRGCAAGMPGRSWLNRSIQRTSFSSSQIWRTM
jgi:hypothetical protein